MMVSYDIHDDEDDLDAGFFLRDCAIFIYW